MSQIIKEHFPLIIVTALALIWGFIVDYNLELGNETVFTFFYLREYFLLYLLAPLLIFFYVSLKTLYKQKSFTAAKSELQAIFTRENFYRLAVCFICIYLILNVFIAVKSLLNSILPYQYDQLFAVWDRAFHGGRYPHEYMSFLTSNPYAIIVIDWLYTAWFYIMYGYLAWVLFQPAYKPGRMKYIVCFCLCWLVLGNLFSIVGSSVGPIFWQHYVLEYDNPYDRLIDQLTFAHYHHPLNLFYFSNWLLEMQNNDTIIDFNAPSAMPSVHVGMVALMAFHSWRYNRLFFPPVLLYLIFTVIGSVVLAWHYAIDGYAAIIMMFLMWKVVGFYLPDSQKSAKIAK